MCAEMNLMECKQQNIFICFHRSLCNLIKNKNNSFKRYQTKHRIKISINKKFRAKEVDM
jgi:hypothetical protein